MNECMQFDSEFELAQLEIQELDSKRAEAVETTRKIQETLKEWEAFMTEMIGTSSPFLHTLNTLFFLICLSSYLSSM
jgi:hypothetical protein